MNCDSAFAIGLSHAVCQDYATHGNAVGERTYAFISDGCSSSPDSDIGARLLALSAAKALKCGGGHETVGRLAISEANFVAMRLAVDSMALDATLLGLVTDGDHLLMSAFGDGVAWYRWAGGDTRYFDIEYNSGYPDYLSYRLDQERFAKFKAVWSGAKATITDNFDSGVIQGSILVENGKGFSHSIRTDRLELAAVMSDGIKSFRRRNEAGASEQVPLHEVLDLMMKFKTFGGRFVQRRINGFLKEAAKLGWKHFDDISMAVIHFKE